MVSGRSGDRVYLAVSAVSALPKWHLAFTYVLCGRLLDQAPDPNIELEDEPVLALEQLIVRIGRAQLENDSANQRIWFLELQSRSDSEIARLHPRMRWAAALVLAEGSLRNTDYTDATRYADALEDLRSSCDFADCDAATLNLRAELALRVEAFDLAYDFGSAAVSVCISGRCSRRSWLIAHSLVAWAFQAGENYEAAIAHRLMAAEVGRGMGIVDEIKYRSAMVSTYAMAGDVEASATALRDVSALARVSNPWQPFIDSATAAAARAGQDYELAASHAGAAAEGFDAAGFFGLKYRAVAEHGSVLVDGGRPMEAVRVVKANLAPADRFEHPMLYRVLIKAYREMGLWDEVVRCQGLIRDHVFHNGRDLRTFVLPLEQSSKVDELRRRNALLDEQNREFEVLSSARQMLVNVIAHEVRTPVTSLDLVLHTIAGHAARSEDVTRFATLGSQLVDRVRGYSDQVATVGELSSGGLKLELSSLDLDRVMKSIIDEQRLVAARKGIILKHIPCGLWAQGHQGRFEQVLANLVSNAIKFSKAETEVEISVLDRGAYVYLTVKDQGCGLVPSDHAKMFQRHTTLSATPTAGEFSTGMGLYIAKQLSLAMGGDLRAYSAGRGQGARFVVQLPSAAPGI